MSLTDERWAEEESWWTMGPAEARKRMHPSCVMAFAQGLMQGDEILASLDTAPRWENVVMADRLTVENEDCIVLAYRAAARRPDGATREAFCTSTWVRQEDGWKLLQHQQTEPAARD